MPHTLSDPRRHEAHPDSFCAGDPRVQGLTEASRLLAEAHNDSLNEETRLKRLVDGHAKLQTLGAGPEMVGHCPERLRHLGAALRMSLNPELVYPGVPPLDDDVCFV